jgi:hypothetical protein
MARYRQRGIDGGVSYARNVQIGSDLPVMVDLFLPIHAWFAPARRGCGYIAVMETLCNV